MISAKASKGVYLNPPVTRYTHAMTTDEILSTDKAEKPATATTVRKRRKMSAAARKRIGDAQRKRWAKQKPR